MMQTSFRDQPPVSAPLEYDPCFLPSQELFDHHHSQPEDWLKKAMPETWNLLPRKADYIPFNIYMRTDLHKKQVNQQFSQGPFLLRGVSQNLRVFLDIMLQNLFNRIVI